MKTLRILIFGLLTAATICHAQITSPGWFVAPDGPITNSQDATLGSLTNNASGGYGQDFLQPSPPAIAEVITPDIQALANSLQTNWQNIFYYVNANIRYVHYFGSKKGAELTLLEKSGNDFDQCALLVALLRAANYSNVGYQLGWMGIPYDAGGNDLHHWLGLGFSNTNWLYTSNYVFHLFGRRGFPAPLLTTGDSNTFVFPRVWVVLTNGASVYYLDPAFKTTQPIQGINLTNAIGFSSNVLMTAAGGTDTGSYVTNMNEANIRSTLTTYTTNLLNYIQTNNPNASVQQILGGQQIVPYTLVIGVGSTSYYGPFFGSVYTVWQGAYTNTTVNWTYLPTNLMSSLNITLAGTNWQCWMPQLEGQRLSLTYSNNGVAQLWLNDSNVVQGQVSTSPGTNGVAINIDHPFGAWNFENYSVTPTPALANSSVTNIYQSTNATYALVYAFEPDWGWLQKRQNQLDAYIQEGYTNTSRQVVSETLNVMGLNWMLQTEAAEQMLADQQGILPQFHHRFGRMAEEIGKGYYVDIYMQYSGEASANGADTNNIDIEHRHADLWSYFFSAFESGLIEQLQNSNLVAASTVKMLELANTNGQAVYLASNGNWSAISGALSPTYNTTSLYNNYISQGYYLLMPQNGTNHLAGAGTWGGYGIAARLLNSSGYTMSMLISGGYNGGYDSNPTITIPQIYVYVDMTGDNQPPSVAISPTGTLDPTAADPVDTADGTFQVEHTDMTLGQVEPKGITLSRYYNGTRRYANPAGMAPGWINNYYLTADTIAAPEAALGGTTPAQAAAMITATCAAINNYNDTPDPANWLVTALIAKWGADQLTKGGVSVNLGQDIYQFVRQPNGVYTPPANCTMTLTQSGSSYSLQERHGRTFNFNPAGLLTNIVDQYGNALTVSYTNNLVSTVTDWKSRTLNFNYNASSQLTSVSDNNTPSRSISYGYNTNGDLVSYTDPEGKTTTYAYDTNHEIITTTDAKNQLVVSNTYDGVGHVAQQYTEGLTNKIWQIFWTGVQTIEQDPTGSQRIFYYDNQGRLTGLQDQLGHLTQTAYDGQNHVTNTISPLGEKYQYSYDGNNNLIQTIDPMNFTNSFIYDANNNLIESIDARGNTNSYGYNAEFSLTGQTNGAGDWINYVYNLSGSSAGTLAEKINSGGTNTYGYDAFGQLNSITYPNGDQESFANNSLGDMTNHVNGRGYATSFQYDNRRELTNSIGPTNLTVKIAFDAVGNKASITDARGNSSVNLWSPTRMLQSTTLPSTAQGVPVLTNIYDNQDWLVASFDPLQNETIYTNDLTGKVISKTDPLFRTIRMGYDADGRQISLTNASGEKTLQQWNADSLLVKVTDNTNHTVTRGYDGAGDQITLTNRNAKKWQFQYDAANRLTNTISPLGYSTTVSFNHQGLPTFMEDAKNHITTNIYDGNGRLTNRDDSIGTTVYGYDANNNITNVTDSGLTNSWAYDAYDRASSYRDALGNLIQYKYDANGNLTNLIYPGSRNVYYAYDSNNHLTNVLDWSGRKTSITYDLDGRLTKIVRPNGTQRIISYDVAGQTTNILEANALGFPLALFEFAWNSNSTAQWEFDAPLPHTNAPPLRTMTYDSDNRLSTFKLGTGSTLTVGSDADGNMTNAPLTTNTLAAFTYDARNRLVTVGGVTNFYDGMNNRILQTQGTNITEYVINPNAQLPQVLMRIKNGVTNYYIYGPGLLYQITETPTGTNTLTYHYDYRGSTIALSSDSGPVTDRMEYSLYATMTYRSGTNDTPFLFNGRYGVQTDSNGLLYMKARYYSPYLCRFINPDPSGFSGGLNFYTAFNGNPATYIDPSGLNAQATGDTGYNWIPATGTDPSNPFGLNTTEGEVNSMNGENTSPSTVAMNANDTLSSTYPFYNANPSRSGVQGILTLGSLVPIFGEFDLLAVGTDLAVDGGASSAAGDSLLVGYHATNPANVDSILQNGFYDSTAGRLGGGGVYVNDSQDGAIAEYMARNPNGPAPTVLQVQYSPGLNYSIIPPPTEYTVGPLPFAADTLTTESIQMPGTFNTIIRNGSATATPP